MSEYYSSELIRRKPEHDQEYQRAEQKFFAQSPQNKAIYSDQGLKDQWIDKQVSKTLRLQEMG